MSACAGWIYGSMYGDSKADADESRGSNRNEN